MNPYFEEFLDKAKDLAEVAGKKTEKMVEVSKYKLESVRLNNEIKKAYERLGSSVYAMMKDGYENQELVEGIVDDIDELMLRLDAVTEKLAELRKTSGSKDDVISF